MAEFCLECWNELNGTNDKPSKYVITKDYYFCEGCSQWKQVIIIEKKNYYWYIIRRFMRPFIFIWKIIDFLGRLLIFPYFIYIYVKYNKK